MTLATASEPSSPAHAEPDDRSAGPLRRMFTGRLGPVERGLIALAGIAVLLALVLPIWWIYLWAPQYPGGLNVLIHSRDLSGDIQNVNILNHYIGMKPLSVEMFPEFTWLTPVLSAIGGILLLVAMIGRRELFLPAFLLLFAFDGYMLYDLGSTLHDWGHNLDPRAPMTVAPFMPPVLGYKQIANFVVYSVPSWGGLLVMAASALGVLLPWRRLRRG